MNKALVAAVKAGEEIMDVYGDEFDVEIKEDNSPLTIADQRSNDKIEEILGDSIPILSEEGKAIEYAERKDWVNYWIVDPLDGTKEFIKRNGEFTVNIALMEGNRPIGGVIYLPVKQTLYFAAREIGSFRITVDGTLESSGSLMEDLITEAVKLPAEETNSVYKVVASRSHLSPETEAFVEELRNDHDQLELVSSGSSIKICLVAEGSANVYPRFAPTMEWDTAAGDAIATFAGKQLIDHTTGVPMQYNRENLLNNWFIVK